MAICDDFADEVTGGEHWIATVNTSSTLSSTLWANGQPSTTYIPEYDEATWLASQLLNPTSACKYSGEQTCAGDISYAIWAIFDPTALNNLLPKTSPDYENAVWWMSQAASNGVPPSSGIDLHGFEILTPSPNVGPGNGGPQEFLYQTPEAPTSVLLGAGVLGLLALIVVFRRGMVQTAH
jgi:hypothetical protein